MPKSLRISKMVAVDWASSVAPPSEDLFSDQSEMRDSSYPSNSYEEYNKKKNSYVLRYFIQPRCYNFIILHSTNHFILKNLVT